MGAVIRERADLSAFEAANSTTGHKIAARQDLPAVTLRRLNQGVVPSKSQYGTILESIALFERD